MKKILANPIAFFVLIVLIVTICVVSIPFINRTIKESNTKSIAEGYLCCVCGKEATNSAGTSKFYCADCYDKEYGDLPVYRNPLYK